MVLLLPLGVVAYLMGVNPFAGGQSPVWYQIAYGVLATSSSIVLTPVWMLGLSLLYVDERVRHEGYDIELMAAQQLGEYPDQGVDSPFGTALSGIIPKAPPPPSMASGRVLNLG
jgi:hypothetical protein